MATTRGLCSAEPTYEELLEKLVQTEEALVKEQAMRASAEEARVRAEKDRSWARKQMESARYHEGRTQKELDKVKARVEKLDREARETASLLLTEQLNHMNTQKEKSELNGQYMSLLRLCAHLLDSSRKLEESLKAQEDLSEDLRKKLDQETKARKAVEARCKALGELVEEAKAQVNGQLNSLEALENQVKDARKAYKQALKDGGEEAKKAVELSRSVGKLQKELTRTRDKLRKDYTNSGLSSAQFPNRKTMTNSTRKRSGKKPGGQPGHPPHLRKDKMKDDEKFVKERVEVPVPDKFLDTTRYKPTDEVRRHQLHDFIFFPVVYEQYARGYLNLRTGKVEFPTFPKGFHNDVNYSGRIKALLFLLVNRCNTSIGAAQQFLKDISDDLFDVSTGFVAHLTEEFAKKSEKEQQEIFDEIAETNVMHCDFTFVRVEGKLGTVLITGKAMKKGRGPVLLQARRKKGLDALPGSPLEHFTRILISDHESTFILHCGKYHQECLQHIQRTLVGIMQNEPGLTWAKEMYKWIQDAIHYRNQIVDGKVRPSRQKSDEFMKRYKEIMVLAAKEYRNGNPVLGYTKGINLFNRLNETSDDYCRFLTDLRVPPTNSVSEQIARVVKRKGHQVMCFRSFRGLETYCESQSVIQEFLRKEMNLFKSSVEIFDRDIPKRGPNKGKTEAIRQAMSVEDGEPQAAAAGGDL